MTKLSAWERKRLSINRPCQRKIQLAAPSVIATYRLLAKDIGGAALCLRELAIKSGDDQWNDEGGLANEIVGLAAVISLECGFPDEAARLRGLRCEHRTRRDRRCHHPFDRES
jgi:hypothetical protein